MFRIDSDLVWIVGVKGLFVKIIAVLGIIPFAVALNNEGRVFTSVTDIDFQFDTA